MTGAPAQVLLFDVGGVLIDFDFSRALAAWAPYSRLPPDQLRLAFRQDVPYERHERGEMSADDYFAHLAKTMQLDATPAQIEAGWNAIFIGEISATLRLVQQARRQFPCHAFTNTNASHMACWMRQYPAVAQAFDSIFASHQMGRRKPEPAAFAHICAALDVAPDAVMFFDDLAENVAAANAAGLQGVLVRGDRDVEEALRGAGLGG